MLFQGKGQKIECNWEQALARRMIESGGDAFASVKYVKSVGPPKLTLIATGTAKTAPHREFIKN
jgi:hypothetical protein